MRIANRVRRDPHQTNLGQGAVVTREHALLGSAVGQEPAISKAGLGAAKSVLTLALADRNFGRWYFFGLARLDPTFDCWRVVPAFTPITGAPQSEKKVAGFYIHLGLNQHRLAGVVFELEIRRWLVDRGIGPGQAIFQVIIIRDHQGMIAPLADRHPAIHGHAKKRGADLTQSAAHLGLQLIAFDHKLGQIAVLFGKRPGELQGGKLLARLDEYAIKFLDRVTNILIRFAGLPLKLE